MVPGNTGRLESVCIPSFSFTDLPSSLCSPAFGISKGNSLNGPVQTNPACDKQEAACQEFIQQRKEELHKTEATTAAGEPISEE